MWWFWTPEVCRALFPPPKDPKGTLRYYGASHCQHPHCNGTGRCIGHYTRPAWDQEEPERDPREDPWPDSGDLTQRSQ